MVCRSETRAHLRCFGQQTRAIGADAEVDRQTASELNRVLNVESEEGRLRFTLKTNGSSSSSASAPSLQLSFFTCSSWVTKNEKSS